LILSSVLSTRTSEEGSRGMTAMILTARFATNKIHSNFVHFNFFLVSVADLTTTDDESICW
jgi:hypothetical protein